MAKTIFEEMGGTYVRQGDYFIPCLTLPAEKKTSLSVYGGIGINAICKNIKEQPILPYLQAASWTVILLALTNRRKKCFLG